MSSLRAREDKRALAGALRYVRSGVRSTHEVLQFLRRRGLSPRPAARLIEAYHARGLLDDRAGARLWAGHWARRGYASAAIRLKLSDKGFGARVIDDAVANVCPPETDEERARAVLTQRLHQSTRHIPPPRLVGALVSRGHDPDVIERVLREVLDRQLPEAE